MRYKLETSGTLHAPAKGIDSLEQTLANTKGECRGTFSLAQASQKLRIPYTPIQHTNQTSKGLGNQAPTANTSLVLGNSLPRTSNPTMNRREHSPYRNQSKPNLQNIITTQKACAGEQPPQTSILKTEQGNMLPWTNKIRRSSIPTKPPKKQRVINRPQPPKQQAMPASNNQPAVSLAQILKQSRGKIHQPPRVETKQRLSCTRDKKIPTILTNRNRESKQQANQQSNCTRHKITSKSQPAG